MFCVITKAMEDENIVYIKKKFQFQQIVTFQSIRNECRSVE